MSGPGAGIVEPRVGRMEGGAFQPSSCPGEREDAGPWGSRPASGCAEDARAHSATALGELQPMPRLPAEAAMLSSPTSFEPPMESPPGPRLADDRPKTMLPKWHPGSQPRSFSLSSGEEPLPLLPPDSVARIGRGQGQVSSRSGRSPRRSDGDQPGRCSKRTAIVAAEAQSPKPGPGDFAGPRYFGSSSSPSSASSSSR